MELRRFARLMRNAGIVVLILYALYVVGMLWGEVIVRGLSS